MANVYAVKTGNWSDPTVWNTGALPTSADDVYANNFTVTIDINPTVISIRTQSASGINAGGGFTISSAGRTLNANVTAGTTTCLTISTITSGQTASVNGNVTGGISTSAHGILAASAGSVTITGTVTGGSGGNAPGLALTGNGPVIVLGDVTGGAASNAHGISAASASSAGSVTITGTVTGGSGAAPGLNLASNSPATIFGNVIGGAVSGAHGVLAGSTGTVTITGSVTGGPGAAPGLNISGSGSTNIIGSVTAGPANASYGIAQPGTGTTTITGDVTGGPGPGTSAHGAYIIGIGRINVTGNVVGGTANSNIGILSQGASQVDVLGNAVGGPVATTNGLNNGGTGMSIITGSAIAGTGAHGALNNTTGILRCTIAVGNGWGLGAPGSIGNFQGVASVNRDSLTYVERLVWGPLGNTPVSGPIILTPNIDNSAVFYLEGGGTKTLVDAAKSDIVPAAIDVRSGVTYAAGSLTGTLAVPAVGSVALGIPVDNTTGTAVLTPESVRAAVGLASANLDTQLDALPTAAEIAQAVWEYTTRTLSDVSAIVSGVWAAATRTVTGGTIDSVANLDAPTEAEIAAAVRTELATELGRIDVATSTRLAPSGTLARVTLTDTTTAVTDTAGIADAVRTELTPELARVANTATTQEVADIVEGAANNP